MPVLPPWFPPRRPRRHPNREARAWSVLFPALVALLFASCANIEKAVGGLLGGAPDYLDQGIVNFDDTGNILVTFNNTEFRNSSVYNETSFIGVFVYDRGADPYSRCCSGSTCDATQAKSCLKGFGFSNDLGFAGSYYYDLHPPRIFNKNADKYFMQVYAANSDSTPMDYQGEYTTFSSSVGPVGDRAVFDLYLGTYYSVFAPGVSPHRIFNDSEKLGSDTVYLPVAPDFLSPVIQIESRFFPESEGDPPGSTFPIPPMISWARNLTIPFFDDFRNRVIINEIVFTPNYNGSVTDGAVDNPEWVEILNNSGQTISMNGWQLSVKSRPTVTLGKTTGTTFLATTSVPPGARLIVAYYNSGVPATKTCGVTCGPIDTPDFDFADNVAVVHITDTDSTGLPNDGVVRLYQDSGNTIIDYIEWTSGATSATCGDESGASAAANAGIWTTGDCVKNTGGAVWGIKRVPDATDTNSSGNWQTGSAAAAFSPGAVNF